MKLKIWGYMEKVKEDMWSYYDKFFKKAKNYALKKVVKSDYLKETTSILPLTLLTIVTKSIFNFLITSRLRTEIYIVDMTISIGITVVFSLSSPFFYNLFNKTLKDEMDEISKYIIDSFWLEGWKFYDYWKIRIFGTVGIVSIFLLFFIEINSRFIQEFIFHTLISSAIVDYITKMKLQQNENGKKEGIEGIEEKEEIPRVKILFSPPVSSSSSSHLIHSTSNMIESYYSKPNDITIIDDYSNINDSNEKKITE